MEKKIKGRPDLAKKTDPEQEELSDQELNDVSGGTSSLTKPRFGGGPIVHALGPKQDDPNTGGGSDR